MQLASKFQACFTLAYSLTILTFSSPKSCEALFVQFYSLRMLPSLRNLTFF